jgi:hypothetical protein
MIVVFKLVTRTLESYTQGCTVLLCNIQSFVKNAVFPSPSSDNLPYLMLFRCQNVRRYVMILGYLHIFTIFVGLFSNLNIKITQYGIYRPVQEDFRHQGRTRPQAAQTYA